MASLHSATRLVNVPTALASPGNVSVIGVVVDIFRGAFKSRGSSSCITFTIKDSDLQNGHTWDGLKIKYFKDNDSQLPPVQLGDVILLRNIWVRQFNGKPLGVAAQDKNVPWAIFRHSSDPTSTATPICGPDHFEVSMIETRRAKALLEPVAGAQNFRDESVATIAPSPSFVVQASRSSRGSGAFDKFSFIRDVRERTFVDLVCEVVKLDLQDSRKVLLYVTDYTENRKLYDRIPDDGDVGFEGDRFNYQRRRKKPWLGPSGQRTLLVTLWEPHASYARNLQESDFVRLNNVHIKLDPCYQNLEAAIHTNRQNPDLLLIDLINAADDDQARDLLHRKEEYWKQNPRKRRPDEEEEEESAPAPKPKKIPKRQGKQDQNKREEGQKPLTIKKQQTQNPNIRAGKPGVKCRTIEEIMANESHENESPDRISYRLPFQNLSYRSKVHVVDFFPPNLEDFAVPVEAESRRRGRGDAVGWEWRFCLLVESAEPPPAGQLREQMRLYVSREEGVHLLNLDATDLRKNQSALQELREKIFLLWGNLEEQKRTPAKDQHGSPIRVSSLPFDCCIQEYGVVCGHRAENDDFSPDKSGCQYDDCLGWERRYAMFMTTILV